MDRSSAENPKRYPSWQGWPCWEPYIYTVGVLIAFVAFIIACGLLGDFLDQRSFGWPIFFGLCTMGALIGSLRKSRTMSSLTGNLLISTFFSLAAISYAALAVCYGLLGMILFALVVKAGRRKCPAVHAKLVSDADEGQPPYCSVAGCAFNQSRSCGSCGANFCAV